MTQDQDADLEAHPAPARKPVDHWSTKLSAQWVRVPDEDVQAVVPISDNVLVELHVHGFEIMRRVAPEDYSGWHELNDGSDGA